MQTEQIHTHFECTMCSEFTDDIVVDHYNCRVCSDCLERVLECPVCHQQLSNDGEVEVESQVHSHSQGVFSQLSEFLASVQGTDEEPLEESRPSALRRSARLSARRAAHENAVRTSANERSQCDVAGNAEPRPLPPQTQAMR